MKFVLKYSSGDNQSGTTSSFKVKVTCLQLKFVELNLLDINANLYNFPLTNPIQVLKAENYVVSIDNAPACKITYNLY